MYNECLELHELQCMLGVPAFSATEWNFMLVFEYETVSMLTKL